MIPNGIPHVVTCRPHNATSYCHCNAIFPHGIFLILPQANTHTTILRLCGFCLGQPGWAGTRRNTHPPTS